MKQLLIRISGGLATAGMLTVFMATNAYAAEISNNGAGSTNTIVETQTTQTQAQQSNQQEVQTIAIVVANTGFNDTNGNTVGNGGAVGSSTGPATAEASVKVRGGSNIAVLPDPCGCPTGDNLISNNGAGSTNAIVSTTTKGTNVQQQNQQSVWTLAVVAANSGGNDTNYNTVGDGGSVHSSTGAAHARFKTKVKGGSNLLLTSSISP